MRVDLKFLLEFMDTPDRFSYTSSYTGDIYDRKSRWGTNNPYSTNPKSGALNINVSAEKRGVPEQSAPKQINPDFLKKIDDQPGSMVTTVTSPFKMNKSPIDSRSKQPIRPHADSNPVKSIIDRNMQSNYTTQTVMNRIRMG